MYHCFPTFSARRCQRPPFCFLKKIIPATLTLLLFCSGCATQNIHPAVSATPTPEPTWTLTEESLFCRALCPTSQGMQSWTELTPALDQSLAYLKKKNPDAVVIQRAGKDITWGDLQKTLRVLRILLPRLDAQAHLLAEYFEWYNIGSIAYTGYYEPVLRASHTYKKGYQPLYRMPPELKKSKSRKAYSRTAIDCKGSLKNRGLEIAWVKDPVEAFILQVQGSGRLEFEDGTQIPIVYAGQNGYTYVSLGRKMVEQGMISKENMNMDAIRVWLAANPQRRQEVLNWNQSYVFFRVADKGPIGSMGRTLKPWASLAVDRNVVPLGALMAFDVIVPHSRGTRKVCGLGLAQDTGGAIKGKRIDLFCGQGREANYTASYLNTNGDAWMLLLKE